MQDQKTELAVKFGIIRSICYNKRTELFTRPTSVSGKTKARTNGVYLTEVNPSFFNTAGMETTFAVLLHEVSHFGGGDGYGKGKCSHNPDFWEEVQSNMNKILQCEKNRCLVESAFGKDFDWHRAKYRLVQSVSQVDERIESVEKRQKIMADSISYDNIESFEHSNWGLRITPVTRPTYTGKVRVNISSEPKRLTDDYTDSELLDFINDEGNECPLPVVNVKSDIIDKNGAQVLKESSNWKPCMYMEEKNRKALAVQERLGFGYTGASIQMLKDVEDKSIWRRILPHGFEFNFF